MTKKELSQLLTDLVDDPTSGVASDSYLIETAEETAQLKKDDPRYADVETWIAALRSGKYTQTDGVLYTPNTGGFCCLGVYCAVINHAPIIDLEGVPMPWQLKHPGEGVLPFPRSLAVFFASLNDGGGLSFAEIADVAEVLLLGRETAEATA